MLLKKIFFEVYKKGVKRLFRYCKMETYMAYQRHFLVLFIILVVYYKCLNIKQIELLFVKTLGKVKNFNVENFVENLD